MSIGQEYWSPFGENLSIYNPDDMTFVNFINSKQVVFSSVKITILLVSHPPPNLEGKGYLPYFAIKISHINVKYNQVVHEFAYH